MVKKIYLTEAKKDFNGSNVRLVGTWIPTSKTSVSVNTWRELASIDDVNAGFSLNRGVSVVSAWELSTKLKVDASAKSEKRDYTGSLLPLQVSYDRRDHFKELALFFNLHSDTTYASRFYFIKRNLDSSVDQLTYRSNAAQVSLRYDFGSNK